MKQIVRNTIFFILFSPLILMIHLTTLFFGRQKSFAFWRPRITQTAKLFVKLFVPDIQSADQFDQMTARMKSRMWFWGLLWDTEIKEDTRDMLKLNLLNCPFCEVFSLVGLAALNPAACEGDWAYARECKDKWRFERTHQIGTGDRFCDHTYKRLIL